MFTIFLSYRRGDSQDVTSRIYDGLVDHFSAECVFKDVDSIPPGTDFRRVLEDAVGRAEVVIAVIGPGWLSATDRDGARRLDDPNDFVRLELEQAFRLAKPVIPVTVAGATMVGAADLPEALAPLAFRHGVPVRPDPDFRADMARLISALEQLSPELLERAERRQGAKQPRRTLSLSARLLCALVLLVAVGVGGIVLLGMLGIGAVGLFMADEMTGTITKIESEKLPDLTTPAAKVHVLKQEKKDSHKKKEQGDLGNEIFKDAGPRPGVVPKIRTDDDGKITEVQIIGGKKKKAQ